ncbi:hypothetical protein GN958_ATG08320 [Phytophthora infestans]|uniref:Uncharacterized protein n=1 Tax=Phytophthora infestans TaxID=4787 RepID=A0A8S9UNW9_PHYIN|nr:hypothetical protein GN958_ATG08320 [Phytophthora infestans]
MDFIKEPLIVACDSNPNMLRPRPAKSPEAEFKQRKNKDKIELLRREIVQRPKRKAGILMYAAKSSVWKGIASRQRRERERALSSNEELKRRLIEQQLLAISLSKLLSERVSLPVPPPTTGTAVVNP